MYSKGKGENKMNENNENIVVGNEEITHENLQELYGVDNVDKVIYQLSVDDVLSVMADKFQEELSAMTDEEIVELTNQVSDNFQIDEWTEIMYHMIDFFINLKR